LCNITTGYTHWSWRSAMASLPWDGRRAMDLKYSNVGDYAREELGMTPARP